MRRYLLGAVSGAALVAAVVSFPRVQADVRERTLSCEMLKARKDVARKLVDEAQAGLTVALTALPVQSSHQLAAFRTRKLAEAVAAEETMRALAEVRGCDIIAKSPGDRL